MERDTKLTKQQAKIILMMRDGWYLVPDMKTVCIARNAGEVQKVSNRVYYNLIRKGIVYADGESALTELGKSIQI